jgi:GTP-binding protein HflX
LKALLVECLTRGSKSRIDETSDIARTAGYTVAGRVTQHRDFIDGAYYVGEGKLREIAEIIRRDSIDTVIFARELSAGQVFRIGKRLGMNVKVMDRNLLILDVFEKRSNTTETKLQVTLARLRYTFSWGRESIKTQGFIGEQMGRGGPGQYPYEAYEAMSRKRISQIEEKLRQIRLKQSHLRNHREHSGFRIIALTGYTQSGKTTLFNKLTSETKEVGLGPFTTLSTFARRLSNSPSWPQYRLILIDSIGFIEDLNPLLLNAFHTTLNELANSDLILLFVDASDNLATVIDKVTASYDVLTSQLNGVPVQVCVNKIDITDRDHLNQVSKEIRKIFGQIEIIEISSKTGDNVQQLLQTIAE